VDAWLEQLLDDLYAKMTPKQIADFERRLREEIARFDAWPTKAKPREGTNRKVAKKR
jgi:hypothetical protein